MNNGAGRVPFHGLTAFEALFPDWASLRSLLLAIWAGRLSLTREMSMDMDMEMSISRKGETIEAPEEQEEEEEDIFRGKRLICEIAKREREREREDIRG